MIDPNVSADTVSSRVRAHAFTSALGAALLLYVGYQFIVPSQDSRFALGGRITVLALRVGGVGFAVATAVALLGRPTALLLDAVCSVGVGVSLCLGAALMMSDQGSGLLYIIFGALFIGAGLRSGREWRQTRVALRQSIPSESRFVAPPMTATVGAQLRQRAAISTASGQAGSAYDSSDAAPPPLGEASIRRPRVPDVPTAVPEGFLASFAPKDDADDRSK